MTFCDKCQSENVEEFEEVDDNVIMYLCLDCGEVFIPEKIIKEKN